MMADIYRMDKIEIDGKNYKVPKAVLELLLMVSKERDYYKALALQSTEKEETN